MPAATPTPTSTPTRTNTPTPTISLTPSPTPTRTPSASRARSDFSVVISDTLSNNVSIDSTTVNIIEVTLSGSLDTVHIITECITSGNIIEIPAQVTAANINIIEGASIVQIADIADVYMDQVIGYLPISRTSGLDEYLDRYEFDRIVARTGIFASGLSVSGILSAGSGVFTSGVSVVSGTISASTGIFSSGISANTGLFSSNLNVSGVLSGNSAVFNSGISAQSGVFSSSLGVSGVLSANSGVFTTSLSAVSGNFSQLTLNNVGVVVSGHTHNLSDITDVTASVTEVNYLDLVTGAGTVDATKAVVVDSSKNINGFNNITASGLISGGSITTTGNVTVGGNLNVQGTTTTVNSTTVEIGDNIIRVNTSGLNTGGFEVYNGAGYQSLIWDNVDNRWEFTGPTVQSTGNMLSRTLESTVVSPTAPIVVASTGLVTNLNADLLDNQQGSYYLNYNNFSNTPTIGSGTLTLNVSGSGLSGSASFGANDTGATTFTVTSNATSANTVNTVVSRDSSGNFSAGTITATNFSGGGSSLTSLNASNLSSGTVASGLLPNVTVGSTATGPTASFVSSVSTDAKGRVTSVNTTTHTLATTSTQGIASFDSGDFGVTAGVVTIKASGVGNSQLENDRVTIGVTPLVLGTTVSAISGVSAANPVVLTFFSIDGGTP